MAKRKPKPDPTPEDHWKRSGIDRLAERAHIFEGVGDAWKTRPQSLAFNDHFEQVIESSRPCTEDYEKFLRTFAITEWLRVARHYHVPFFPDEMTPEVFELSMTVWTTGMKLHVLGHTQRTREGFMWITG